MDNTNNLLPQKIRQIQLLLADKAIGKVGSVTTSFDPRDGIMFTCQHVTSALNIADLFAKKNLITLSAKVVKEGQEPITLHLRNCTIQIILFVIISVTSLPIGFNSSIESLQKLTMKVI